MKEKASVAEPMGVVVSREYLRVVNEHGPLVRRTESRRATSGRATGAEHSSYNKPNEGSIWKGKGGLWPTFMWGLAILRLPHAQHV